MNTELYKNVLVPYLTKYTKFRIGKNNDGGYVFLKELFDDAKHVYSYGIASETSFDQACQNYGKNVFMYDPTINGEYVKDMLNIQDDEECKQNNGKPMHIPKFNFNIHSHNLYFKKQPFSKDFLNHVIENGHANETNMVLKIDVEGWEYDGLLNCDEKVFENFSQIGMEVHNLYEMHGDGFPKPKIEMFERLLKHYKIVHIHGNTHGKIQDWLPSELEILFLRNDYFTKFQIDNRKYPILGLDFSNNPGSMDYVLDWWVK